MNIIRTLFAVSTLALGACASAPDYVAADHPGERGYYSHKVAADRYRVVYNGGKRSGLEETRDFALIRAAEVTVREGYDWFEIVDRDTRTESTRQARSGIGHERRYYVDRECSVLGCRSRVYPASYTRFELQNGRDEHRHTHSIEIRLGKGKLPEDGRAYDAAVVLDAMRPETA